MKYGHLSIIGAAALSIAAFALPSTTRYVRAAPSPEAVAEPSPARSMASASEEAAPRDVPFYSQFADITAPEWKKVGCGAASLAMVIDYYRPGRLSVDALVKEGSAQGAYLSDAGWTYKGLIRLSQPFGLDGESYDLAALGKEEAFGRFAAQLADGPVIASVHYEFDPASTIPHLVVIDRIDGDTLYYSDPAADVGGKAISSDAFLKAWKKRYIVIRPA